MDSKEKDEIISLSYESLDRIHAPLKACRSTHLHADFLRDNNIVLSLLDWQPEGQIDFEPRFCTPCPVERFEKLFKRTTATNYWGASTSIFLDWDSDLYDGKGDESTRRLGMSSAARSYLSFRIGTPKNPIHMAANGDWLLCYSEKLYKHRGNQWRDGSPSAWHFDKVIRSIPWPQGELPTTEEGIQRLRRKLKGVPNGDLPVAFDDAIRRPGKKSLVHMAICTYDDSDLCEEKLLRSELIGAIYIMRDSMRQKRCKEQHAIYPVFVYSWSGFHVRVLQVHYDFNTGKLMVRKTSYIEIDGPHREAEIKLMLRWMMNTPIGETRWEELEVKNKADMFEPSSNDRPPSPTKISLHCT